MYSLPSKNSVLKQNQLEHKQIDSLARSMLTHRRFFKFERPAAATSDKKAGNKNVGDNSDGDNKAKKSTLKIIHEERGSQLFEYIAILPMLFIAALIGWQMFMAGHTFIVTANAAREGARVLAVCGGGNVQAAANRTSPGYRPQVLQATRGSRTTTVRIGNQIPKIRIINFLDPALPQVQMKATMRTEECR